MFIVLTLRLKYHGCILWLVVGNATPHEQHTYSYTAITPHTFTYCQSYTTAEANAHD
jgi:hypothetical protein